MAAAALAERMERGGAHRFRLQLYNERTLAVMNITAWTAFWCTIKTAKTDADPGLLQLTLVSGVAVLDAATGLIEVTIPDTFLSASPGVTFHLYLDVKGKDATGIHWILASGRLTIHGDVTRAT